MKKWLKEKKVLETGMICLLPVLLYGLMGPLEIYAGNMNEFVFILKDFIYIFLALSVIIWLIGSFILIMLPKKIASVFRAAVFTVSFLSYIQNMFLNKKLMNSNGDAMDWDSMHSAMAVNLAVWIILAGICIIVPVIWKKYYEKIYFWISAFLCAVQIIAIVSLVIPAASVGYSMHPYALSGEGQFEVAGEDNVIVLLADRYINSVFEATLEEKPEFAEAFKDFTYYNNADSHYNFTFPSLIHLLTGTEYDCSITQDDWVSGCWDSETCEKFYGTLHSLGYECDVYYGSNAGSLWHVGGSGAGGSVENLRGKIDNVVETYPRVQTGLLIRLLEKMTIYKYVPYILKPRFEVQSYIMDQAAVWDNVEIDFENEKVYERLLNEGLSVNSRIPRKFSLTYIQGLHYPLYTDADCRASETITSYAVGSSGICVLLTEYLDQLKELGVYDDATIIILADHGEESAYNHQPVFLIKTPHAVQEEMKVTSAPISHDDFLPTILDVLGQDYTRFGTSIYDWSEGDRRTRELWYPDEDRHGFYIYTYETDRYELLEQSEKDTAFAAYPLQ